MVVLVIRLRRGDLPPGRAAALGAPAQLEADDRYLAEIRHVRDTLGAGNTIDASRTRLYP